MDLNGHCVQLSAGMAGVAVRPQPNQQEFLVEYRPVLKS